MTVPSSAVLCISGEISLEPVSVAIPEAPESPLDPEMLASSSEFDSDVESSSLLSGADISGLIVVTELSRLPGVESVVARGNSLPESVAVIVSVCEPDPVSLEVDSANVEGSDGGVMLPERVSSEPISS